MMERPLSFSFPLPITTRERRPARLLSFFSPLSPSASGWGPKLDAASLLFPFLFFFARAKGEEICHPFSPFYPPSGRSVQAGWTYTSPSFFLLESGRSFQLTSDETTPPFFPPPFFFLPSCADERVTDAVSSFFPAAGNDGRRQSHPFPPFFPFFFSVDELDKARRPSFVLFSPSVPNSLQFVESRIELVVLFLPPSSFGLKVRRALVRFFFLNFSSRSKEYWPFPLPPFFFSSIIPLPFSLLVLLKRKEVASPFFFLGDMREVGLPCPSFFFFCCPLEENWDRTSPLSFSFPSPFWGGRAHISCLSFFPRGLTSEG